MYILLLNILDFVNVSKKTIFQICQTVLNAILHPDVGDHGSPQDPFFYYMCFFYNFLEI